MMEKKTWAKIVLLSSLCPIAASGPAIAGSSYVENDYSIRNIYGGRSRTDVTVDSAYRSVHQASSFAHKMGKTYTTTKQLSRGDLSGPWVHQAFYEVDKFDVSAGSDASEYGQGYRIEKIRVADTYSYSGLDKTHRVTSGFDF